MNLKIILKRNTIVLYLFLISYFYMLATPGVWKYLGTLGIALILLIFQQNKIEKKSWVIALPVLFYILVGGVLLLTNPDLSFIYFIKQFVFNLTPVLSAFVLYGFVKNNVHIDIQQFLDIQIFAIITIFLIKNISHFTSQNLMESQYAFILGLYAVYYLYQKKYPYLMMALFFMYLGHKRIAIAAMCFSMILIAIKVFPQKIQKILLFVLTIGEFIVLYAYLYFCYSPAFLNLRIGLDYLFSGRMKTWNTVNEFYEFSVLYIGKGMGWVLSLLERLNIAHFDNLHNDILSYYIELGFIGFLIWLCLYFSGVMLAKGSHRICVFALLTYTMINLCTDNISIYIVYLVPYYMILLSLINDKRKV